MSWMLTAILKTIRDYDMAVMEGGQPADVNKRYATNTIGKVKRRQDGTYDKSTYSLDSTLLTIRTLAPATSVTLERPQGAPSVNSLDGLPDGIYIVNGKKMLKK